MMIGACFEYGPLVIWCMMLLTVVRPLHLSRCMSVLLSVILLVASQKFLIYKFFGGHTFVPDLPWLFIIIEGWAYSSVMILFMFSLVWMMVRGIIRLVKRFDGVKFSRMVITVFAGCAVMISGWGMYEGIRIPQIKCVPLEIPGLLSGLSGMRFIHLTDIHCSPSARRCRIAKIVNRVRIQQADFVCITGDLVDGTPEQRMRDLEPLKELTERCPVFMCAGNHEYYSDYVVWKPVLESYGLKMLDNAHCMIDRCGDRFAIGGVTDPVAERFGFEPTNVKKAFDGIPEEVFKILLQHRPLNPQTNADLGIDLQLSGHTHGGAILGLDRLVAHMGNNGFVRGLYKIGAMFLYVGSGSGQWAGFPLRLGVPAEITEFRLIPAPVPARGGW